MFSFTAINKAEAIINNPNKTTLTDDEKDFWLSIEPI